MWNRNPNVFWGGVLVIVGVLFLLANLNVLQNVTWDLVWPVFLIALGVWLVAARIGPGGASMDVDTSEPRDGMDRAKLEVVVGAGRLEVRAAPLDEQLYRVHIDTAALRPRSGSTAGRARFASASASNGSWARAACTLTP